jgi:hypothetical protein
MRQAFIVDLELTPDRELSAREVSRWLGEALARSAKPCPLLAFGLSVQSVPPFLHTEEDDDAPREAEPRF